LKEYIYEILLSETAISQRVKELGKQISRDYKDQELVIICVLKGAVIFLADLLRNLDISTIVDFIQVSSYGDKTESSGNIEISKNLNVDIQNRNVLIVDDIFDSGLTLKYLYENLKPQNPLSLKSCVLLEKVKSRKVEIKIDYVGFQIPDKFVIGYGLDYGDYYRGLRHIAIFKS